MSSVIRDPFNIKIVTDLERRVRALPRVLTPEIYLPSTNQLHPDGLYSISKFGQQGTDERFYTFGYIKLHTKVMIPHICKWLTSIKRLHEDIWMGRTYAKFDNKTKSFYASDDPDAKTGYHFFLQHIEQVNLKGDSKSSRRAKVVQALEKNRGNWFLEYCLVIPPGLRDITVDEDGKRTEDEINEYYRKIIRLANSLEHLPSTQGEELNQVRVAIQTTMNECDEYIYSLLEGKKGILAGKWASRKLHLSSRNVISAQDPSVADLDDPARTTTDTTQMGLFQIVATAKPIILSYFRSHAMYTNSFNTGSYTARLIDSRTLHRHDVNLPDEVSATWTSVEGFSKLVKKFAKQSFRSQPVIIHGHYLALVYRDDVKYQILYDIDELPSTWDRNNVHPITYLEFFYLIGGYEKYSNFINYVTRYPSIGERSTYLSELQILPTVDPVKLKIFENGEDTGRVEPFYPNMNNLTYLESTSVAASRIKPLDGDYDGDKVSDPPIYSEEAKREYHALKNKRMSVFTVGGDPRYVVNTDMVERAVLAMTKSPHPNRINRSTRGATNESK